MSKLSKQEVLPVVIKFLGSALGSLEKDLEAISLNVAYRVDGLDSPYQIREAIYVSLCAQLIHGRGRVMTTYDRELIDDMSGKLRDILVGGIIKYSVYRGRSI